MKIVINNDYGGFWLDDSVLKAIGSDDTFGRAKETRTNKTLIDFVESGFRFEGFKEDEEFTLSVVEIPDEGVTDWDIYDYDGVEWVVYVLDGKLHSAEPYGSTRKTSYNTKR